MSKVGKLKFLVSISLVVVHALNKIHFKMSWKFMFGENIEVFKRIQELDPWIFYISTWDQWFIVWRIFTLSQPKNLENLEILLI
jgi:hypothetical protein